MGLDLKKSFGYDKKAAEEGAWFDLGDGARVKMRSLTRNYGYEDFARREGERIRAEKAQYAARNKLVTIDKGLQLTQEEVDRLARRAFARYVVLGWEGIEEGGSALPFSAEAAERLFDAYPSFYDLLLQAVTARDAFSLAAEEELEKNCAPGSGGNSTGPILATLSS